MEAYKALADNAAEALPLFTAAQVTALQGLEPILQDCAKLADALEVWIVRLAA